MIRNYCRLDALNLASIFGNESLKFIPSNYLSSGISIDTRTIEAGNIFIALKGSKLDGHAKIDEAMANGASAVIVEESFIESIAIDYPHIIVNDTLEALGMLAKYHRRLFDYPVIAIAGSNGKTTTKEFTAHLLASRFNVLKTHENFNNRLGVPLMLLTMTQEHEAAVIEIATNEPGEISILSDILQPTHGLITNIGEEHLEKLIDLTGVEVEESYLFGYLLKHDGTCFINTDDSRLAKYSKIIEKKVEYGTRPTAQVKANIIYNEMMIPTLRIKFEDRKIKANLKTTGRTTALNALAAASIALNLGLTDDELRTGLESFNNSGIHGYGRMAVELIGGITIINDCYNANPSSMIAAYKTLKKIETNGFKYAALGDMYELGESAEKSHLQILKLFSNFGGEVLITGAYMSKAFAALKNKKKVLYFNDKTQMADYLLDVLKPTDCLLIKASRGMKMEDVANAVKSKFNSFEKLI